jgi:hypothetical protein
MQTLTAEITNDNPLKILQDLQERHFINILAKSDPNSVIFPGEPLTPEEFREFILGRENGTRLSLKEANAKWAKKRKQLHKPAL